MSEQLAGSPYTQRLANLELAAEQLLQESPELEDQVMAILGLVRIRMLARSEFDQQ